MSKTLRITACPTCGSNKIKKVRRNWTGEYRGQTFTVTSLEYYDCPVCGEKVYDRNAMRKIEAGSPAFAHAHLEQQAA